MSKAQPPASLLIPDDDPVRKLAVKSERDDLPHFGVVDDTYKIVLSGGELQILPD